MNSTHTLIRRLTAPTVVSLGLMISGPLFGQALTGTSLTVTGPTALTGSVSMTNSQFTFGPTTTDFATWIYTASATDTLSNILNRNPSSWLWEQGTSTALVPVMRLDSSHNLLLYPSNSTSGTAASITLTPATTATSPALSLGGASLTNVSGVLTTNSPLTVGGNIINTAGSLTGGAAGLALNAGSANQNISFTTPTGTGDIIFNTNGTERARIKSTGFVGIGTNAPGANLDVKQPTTGHTYLRLETVDGSNFIQFQRGATVYNSIVSPYATPGDFALFDNVNSAARLYVSPIGNVGLGTTNATSPLTVSNVANVKLELAGGTSQNAMLFDSASGGDQFELYEASNRFGIYDTTNSADRLVISNNGNVGIGTNAPGAKLEVDPSGGNVGIRLKNSGLSTNWDLYAYSDNNFYINNPNGSVLGIAANATANLMYLSGGSVGIGTTTPTAKLHVFTPATTKAVFGRDDGAAAENSLIRINTAGSSNFSAIGFDVGPVPTAGAAIWLPTNGSGLYMMGGGATYANLASTAPQMTIAATGNVGIGTATPAASLDVGGVAAANGALTTVVGRLGEGNGTGSGTFLGVRAWASQPVNAKMFSIESTFYGVLNNSIEFYRGASTSGGYTTFTTGNGTERVRIDPSGNVGIGTSNPTQKLSVAGTIQAYAVVVNTGWSDYVFDKDYRLAPLSEVEQHIKADKHLPGIPSAQEVAEHGVSVGDMESKLLAKVEELTLHLIAQEKHMIAQEKEINSLRQQVTELKAASQP